MLKNATSLSILILFLYFFIQDSDINKLNDIQPDKLKNGQCIKNRTRVRTALENNGYHLMKGFTCTLLNGNLHESACRAEDMSAKRFFNDNQVLKRLRSMLLQKFLNPLDI